MPESIVADCSYARSHKNPRLPPLGHQDCAQQILRRNRSNIGAVVESFREGGSQPSPAELTALRYGCSVTEDACIRWDDSVAMLRESRALLKDRLPKR